MERGSKMSNQEMIDNIKRICGKYSISYYNIRNYANADNFVVGAMYTQMLEREKAVIEEQVAELRKKLELIDVCKQV